MVFAIDVIIIFTIICHITFYLLGAPHSMRRAPFVRLTIEAIFGICVSLHLNFLKQ